MFEVTFVAGRENAFVREDETERGREVLLYRGAGSSFAGDPQTQHQPRPERCQHARDGSGERDQAIGCSLSVERKSKFTLAITERRRTSLCIPRP